MNKQQIAYRNLFNSLSSGVFAIEASAAQRYYPLVKSFLEGNVNAFQNFYDEDEDEDYNKTGLYEEESVTAVIHISGVIMKSDGWCHTGTQSLAKKIKALEADDKVNSILLKIDSPGGMVDGTQALHETLKNCTKPTLAFVDDGLCASAAYWIASGCDEIWTSKSTDRIGSIGTMIRIANLDKMYENEGIEIHDIYATKSKDKNKDFEEAAQGNYKTVINEMLNPINDEFINSVKSTRTNISEKTLTGKVFMATQAIKLGLIDQIGSYEDAVLHLSNKAKSSKSSSNTPQNNDTMSKKTFWQSFFSEDKSEEQIEKEFESKIESSEKWTALVAENEAFKTELQSVKAEKTALESKLATLEAQNATLEAANKELKAENEKYSTIAGTEHTRPQQTQIEETPNLKAEVTNEDILKNSPFAKKSKKLRGEE